MLTVALVLLIGAILALVFWITGGWLIGTGLAQILFIVFFILFLLSLVMGLARKPPRV